MTDLPDNLAVDKHGRQYASTYQCPQYNYVCGTDNNKNALHNMIQNHQKTEHDELDSTLAAIAQNIARHGK